MLGVSGAVPLAPLTDRGRAQALSAAETPVLRTVTRLYTSTALRARETAEIIGAVLGVDVVALPELVEVGLGRQDGVMDQDLRRDTADVLHDWVVHGDLIRRVADGENGAQVLARIDAALTAIAAAHAGGTVGVVGHVGSLTAGLSVLCGLGARVWGKPLPHAVPFSVSWHGDSWRCEAWPVAI